MQSCNAMKMKYKNHIPLTFRILQPFQKCSFAALQYKKYTCIIILFHTGVPKIACNSPDD